MLEVVAEEEARKRSKVEVDIERDRGFLFG